MAQLSLVCLVVSSLTASTNCDEFDKNWSSFSGQIKECGHQDLRENPMHVSDGEFQLSFVYSTALSSKFIFQFESVAFPHTWENKNCENILSASEGLNDSPICFLKVSPKVCGPSGALTFRECNKFSHANRRKMRTPTFRHH